MGVAVVVAADGFLGPVGPLADPRLRRYRVAVDDTVRPFGDDDARRVVGFEDVTFRWLEVDLPIVFDLGCHLQAWRDRSLVRQGEPLAVPRIVPESAQDLPVREATTSGPLAMHWQTTSESLYAQDASHELAFRTALCGAMHLAPTSTVRLGYYHKLWDFYRMASRVVHGGEPVDNEDLVKWSYETCRRAILKRLGEPGKLDWTALMLGLHEASGEDPRA